MGGMTVPPMWNSVLNLLFPRFLPNCQAIKNCLRTQSLGYFHFIQDFAYNFIRRHIHSLCFVSQADTVAKHIVSNCTNIFGNYVTTTFDERITACCQCQIDRCTREPPKPIMSFSSFKSYFSGKRVANTISAMYCSIFSSR